MLIIKKSQGPLLRHPFYWACNIYFSLIFFLLIGKV